MFSTEEEQKGTRLLVENVKQSRNKIGEVQINNTNNINTKYNNTNNKNTMIALHGYKAAAYVDMNTKQDSSTILGTHGLGNKGLSQSDRGEGIWTLKAELSKLEKRRNELQNEINNNTNNEYITNNNQLVLE